MKIQIKIRLAILDSDKDYVNRLGNVLRLKYANEVELYTFTEPALAFETVRKGKINVFLVSDAFHVDPKELPVRCSFAYFVEHPAITEHEGWRAICKNQKTDQIYKQILGLYADISDIHLDIGGGECTVIAVTSASGGVGASTIAAACAMHFAERHKRVLYLNLETLGSADVFFSGEGQATMGNVILSFKSARSAEALQLKSSVKQDKKSGTYFYSAPHDPLHMMDLNTNDIVRLINMLKGSGEYDCLVVDLEFGLTPEKLTILKLAKMILLVGNGTVTSNSKTERAYRALEALDSQSQDPIIRRMYFLYNGVSSTHGLSLNVADLPVLGGARRYAGGDAAQIAQLLAKEQMFEQIFRLG